MTNKPKTTIFRILAGAALLAVPPAVGLLGCYQLAKLKILKPTIEIIELERQQRSYIAVSPNIFKPPINQDALQPEDEAPFLRGPFLRKFGVPRTEKYWAKVARTTNNEFTKHLSIDILSRAKDKPDWFYYETSLVCSNETLIELARRKATDIRYFSKPRSNFDPSQHLSQQIFLTLKDISQQDNVDECTKYLSDVLMGKTSTLDDQSITLGDDGHDDDNVFAESGHPRRSETSPPAQSLVSISKSVMECLWYYTQDKEQCRAFIMGGGLNLLTRIWYVFSSNEDVMSSLGRIFINITLHSEFDKAFVASGYLYILSQWMRSWNIELQTIATTALTNLSQSPSRFFSDCFLLHPMYSPGVFTRRTEPAVDVIFLHGVNGNSFLTWRQHNEMKGTNEYTTCWPKDWIGDKFEDIRVIGLDYSSNASYWESHCPVQLEKRTIEEQAKSLSTKLIECNVGQRPIIWVGHSYGGLIIKQILHDAYNQPEKADLLTQTSDIIFLGVPHKGSPLADMSRKVSYLYFPAIEILEVSDREKLANLDEHFVNVLNRFKIKITNFMESQKTRATKTIKLSVVPREFCECDYCENILLEADDHISISKPRNRSSPLYQRVYHSIRVHICRRQQICADPEIFTTD